MNNLQLTERGAQVRAVLEKLDAMLEDSDYRKPLVETTQHGLGHAYINGWDMGCHHAGIQALKRAVTTALIVSLPKGEGAEVAS